MTYTVSSGTLNSSIPLWLCGGRSTFALSEKEYVDLWNRWAVPIEFSWMRSARFGRWLTDFICLAWSSWVWLSLNPQRSSFYFLFHLGKWKEADLYSAFIEVPHTQGAQVWITQCYLQLHRTCLYLVSIHQMAHPRLRLQTSNCSLLLIIYPERMKGWVGLGGWLRRWKVE